MRNWTEKHIRELIKRELNKIGGESHTFSVARNYAGVESGIPLPFYIFFDKYQPNSAKFSDKFIELLPSAYYPKRDNNYEYKYVSTLMYSNFDNDCFKNPFYSFETKRNIVLIEPYYVANYFPTAIIDGFYTYNGGYNNSYIAIIKEGITVLKSLFVIQGEKKFALGVDSVLGNTVPMDYKGFIYHGNEYGLPYWASDDESTFYRPSTTVYVQVEPDEIKSFNDRFNVFSSWSEFDWEEETHTVCYNNVYRKNL